MNDAILDVSPVLILWFFDSRGGFSLGANSTRVPDWVDPSVAEWIVSETRAMNAAWGPAENRGALAFVHIPPYVAFSYLQCQIPNSNWEVTLLPSYRIILTTRRSLA